MCHNRGEGPDEETATALATRLRAVRPIYAERTSLVLLPGGRHGGELRPKPQPVASISLYRPGSRLFLSPAGTVRRMVPTDEALAAIHLLSQLSTPGAGGTNWFTLLAATIGGLVGGGLPGVMTYLGWRQDQRERRQTRRWEDAEVLADAKGLLTDIDPMRRGINVDRTPGAEDELWVELNRRRDDVRRRLLVMANGHLSPAVRSAAKRLEVELFSAAVQSEWHVHDLLKGRDFAEHRARAQEVYESAQTVLARLESAVEQAAS